MSHSVLFWNSKFRSRKHEFLSWIGDVLLWSCFLGYWRKLPRFLSFTRLPFKISLVLYLLLLSLANVTVTCYWRGRHAHRSTCWRWHACISLMWHFTNGPESCWSSWCQSTNEEDGFEDNGQMDKSHSMLPLTHPPHQPALHVPTHNPSKLSLGPITNLFP